MRCSRCRPGWLSRVTPVREFSNCFDAKETNGDAEKKRIEQKNPRLFSEKIISEKVMSSEEGYSMSDSAPVYGISNFDPSDAFSKDRLMALGAGEESIDREIEDLDENDDSQVTGSDTDGSDESGEDESDEDESDDLLSQQNMFYFQNMDQLLSNYFANEDVNIVNAIQGLDKTIKEFNKSMKDSMEQNAKCTLRVAKILEVAVQSLKKN
jgi:hypothetical protein